METRCLKNGMPCQNQNQVNSDRRELEHAAKQVRFAEKSSSASVASARGHGEPANGNGSGSDIVKQIGSQLKLLPLNDQIRELQTIIRDK